MIRKAKVWILVNTTNRGFPYLAWNGMFDTRRAAVAFLAERSEARDYSWSGAEPLKVMLELRA